MTFARLRSVYLGSLFRLCRVLMTTESREDNGGKTGV